ncbi:hypothetical protein CR513_11439, partial [Mucuna pruriens]
MVACPKQRTKIKRRTLSQTDITPLFYMLPKGFAGENLHETQLETLVLPSLEFTIHVLKSKQTSLPSSSTENVLGVDKRFEKYLVYQRSLPDRHMFKSPIQFLHISISQQKYVTNLLKETGMVACKPSSTPVDSKLKLGNADDSVTDSG